MLNAREITQHIAHAHALVTALVEGGIDPLASRRAEETMVALFDAQRFLEDAAECWRQPVRHRRKAQEET